MDAELLLPLLLLQSCLPSCLPSPPARGGCPAACSCEQDGTLLRVDCSDRGLTTLPNNLSALTGYLDLSMNNITRIPANSLHGLRYLEELRLAGNDLTNIPRGAFAGLSRLKVLMLQNNKLRKLPSEAFQSLHSLQSLRLDANHISFLPADCFSGLVSLRHLWLDDNALTEIPVQSLRNLPTLQAMTLALNRIKHIPDHAFRNLSSLVVLHLHNNRILSLGKSCFQGLHSLETLDLNYNNLEHFPSAISALTNLKELGFHSNNIKSIPEQAFVGNPALVTIHFYDNPIQRVGKSAFQHLPELRTLTLNGASQIREFPDLNGTTSLESLTLTGAQITSLPGAVCDQLPNLQVLDLSYNRIQEVPNLSGCQSLQKIDLRHNKIFELSENMFRHLTYLRSLDLAWNKIKSIHANAFEYLPSLTRLDLSYNQLSSFPVNGLSGLTHLKLTGNYALQSLVQSEHFPKLKNMDMAYAYQCCAFVACESPYKVSTQWSKDENSTTEDFLKQNVGMVHIQDERDFEGFFIGIEDDHKTHHSVQCSPLPGPFKPCDFLFGSWLTRIGVWTIVLLAVICNALVIASVFRCLFSVSSIKLLIGLIAFVNMLTGLSSGVLASVDMLTFGSFAMYGAWWERGVGCQVTEFMSIFASEASVFLLTVAALERGCAAKCTTKFEPKSSLLWVKLSILFSFLLALAIAMVPMLSFSDFGISPLCLPMSFGEPSAVGLMVALVLLNSLCFLLMTISYTKLYCNLEKGDLESIWDCSMIKHVALLLFTNCILYCPVAFLSFSSLLNLTFISSEVIKSILLVVVPLPACLNPLLYMVFNPHFREDLTSLRSKTFLWKKSTQRSLISLKSEDAEKQSCDSTQALVTFSSGSTSHDVYTSLPTQSSCQMTANTPLSEVSLVPCTS